MSKNTFLRLYGAYREIFGDVYPRRDPAKVLKVLGECAANLQTTQIAVKRVTGVSLAEVNKILDKACRKGWIDREETRTSRGEKFVSLSDDGLTVLADFEKRCVAACEDPGVQDLQPSRHTRKKSSRARSNSGDASSSELF